MNFLPKGYKAPETGNYMKLQQGKNKFRILSEAIVGTEIWEEDSDGNKKPVRFRPDDSIPVDKYDTGDARHFWAFVVYNRNADKIQILEITQKTIQRALKALAEDEDWGNPQNYDITITRKGEGMDTEYTVMPGQKSEISDEIKKEYKEADINLEALFDGEDPFASSKSEVVTGKDEEDVDIDDIPL